MPTPPDVPVPRYGEATLADVMPSVLAALTGGGTPNPLRLEPARSVVLLVVDGLGWQQLTEHAADAPFLSALAAGSRPLDAGFPATTAASITSIGTGRPPGRHGVVGYTFAAPGRSGVLHALRWQVDGRDARDDVPPERVQPLPTAWESAAAAGLRVSIVGPGSYAESGLTRAALRGGAYVRTMAVGDVAAAAIEAVSEPGGLCYAYHPHVDLLGHLHGPGSLPWRLQLRQADLLAESIAAGLPAGSALVVTGDHGMVTVPPEARVDADESPLLDGVGWLAGEPRARYVYARPGARDDVLRTWQELVGDRMWVASREQAVADGWFGGDVSDAARERIGDVVAAAFGDTAVVRTKAEPTESRLVGHHGSLTDAERLVPLLVATGDGVG